MKNKKLKFKVGDTIRRKPLAIYNYDCPIMEIVKITDRLYVFKSDDPIPKAIEILAQDEWELYNSRNYIKRILEAVVKFLHWVFRYHQPTKLPYRYIGQQRRRPGLTLFMYNMSTGEVKRAPVIGGKVITDPKCVYRQALNKKSFLKRLKKEGIIK